MERTAAFRCGGVAPIPAAGRLSARRAACGRRVSLLCGGPPQRPAARRGRPPADAPPHHPSHPSTHARPPARRTFRDPGSLPRLYHTSRSPWEGNRGVLHRSAHFTAPFDITYYVPVRFTAPPCARAAKTMSRPLRALSTPTTACRVWGTLRTAGGGDHHCPRWPARMFSLYTSFGGRGFLTDGHLGGPAPTST
eukprot:gene9543-biopygen10746